MVSASKLRKFQKQLNYIYEYENELHGMLQQVYSDIDKRYYNNPYISHNSNSISSPLIISVSSDRGLCGSFSTLITKKTITIVEDYSKTIKPRNCHIMTIGNKGYSYFRNKDYSLIDSYYDLLVDISMEKIDEIARFILEKFRNKTYDKVLIVHTTFKNIIVQSVVVKDILPLKIESNNTLSINSIYEPSIEELCDDIVCKFIKMRLYRIFLDSSTSEHGARMNSMDKATDNAEELLEVLRISYNRSRQDIITKEISEIVAGSESLA